MHESVAAARFRAAADRLVNRVAHWTPERWARPVGPGATRADRVFGVVQRLADLAAEVEGGSRRGVPRLDNDLALVDQLKVLAADLVLAGPPPAVLLAAAEAVDSVVLD